jgi:hypothetical protein
MVIMVNDSFSAKTDKAACRDFHYPYLSNSSFVPVIRGMEERIIAVPLQMLVDVDAN